jgi:hypothetical protein
MYRLRFIKLNERKMCAEFLLGSCEEREYTCPLYFYITSIKTMPCKLQVNRGIFLDAKILKILILTII